MEDLAFFQKALAANTSQPRRKRKAPAKKRSTEPLLTRFSYAPGQKAGFLLRGKRRHRQNVTGEADPMAQASDRSAPPKTERKPAPAGWKEAAAKAGSSKGDNDDEDDGKAYVASVECVAPFRARLCCYVLTRSVQGALAGARRGVKGE